MYWAKLLKASLLNLIRFFGKKNFGEKFDQQVLNGLASRIRDVTFEENERERVNIQRPHSS